jgi:hypothetical protein
MLSLGKDEALVKVPTVIIEKTVTHQTHPLIRAAIGDKIWVIVVELGLDHYECMIDTATSLTDAIAILDGLKEAETPDYVERIDEFMSNQELTPRFVVLKSQVVAPGKSEIGIKAIGLDPTSSNRYFAKVAPYDAQAWLGL